MERRLMAEWLGTFSLLATVIGSGIMAERLAGGNVAIALLGTDVIQGRCGAIRRWDGEQKTEWLLTPPL